MHHENVSGLGFVQDKLSLPIFVYFFQFSSFFWWSIHIIYT
jgi:hypothetical protein